jgi:hypothetical protein
LRLYSLLSLVNKSKKFKNPTPMGKKIPACKSQASRNKGENFSNGSDYQRPKRFHTAQDA